MYGVARSCQTKAQVEELYGVDSAAANEVSAEGEGEAQPSEAASVDMAATQPIKVEKE